MPIAVVKLVTIETNNSLAEFLPLSARMKRNEEHQADRSCTISCNAFEQPRIGDIM